MPVSKGNKRPHKNTGVTHTVTRQHHDAPLFESLSKPVIIKPWHHKPFRVRHVGWLLLALIALFILTLQTGLMIGRSKAPSVVIEKSAPASTESSFTAVRSAYGFGFGFDSNQLQATASAVNEGGATETVTQEQLRSDKNLNIVTLRPLEGRVAPLAAATRFVVQASSDKTAITRLKQQPGNEGLTDGQLAAKVLPISQATEFDIVVNGTSTESIDGVPVLKTVYQYNPRFGGGVSYAVVWTGVVDDRAFAIRLQGLVGSSETPEVYRTIFDTIRLASAQKVAGVSTLFGQRAAASTTQTTDTKYQSDLVSPSVVKIYHLVCGTLVVGGTPIGKEGCSGGTGTGFIVSNDGYIATNGHVVVMTAKDAFVRFLTSDPKIFGSFLKGLGMTDAQINQTLQRSDLLAAIISKIYDLPDEQVKFDNMKEVTFVALGNEPLPLEKQSDVRDAMTKAETENLKQAKIIGTNYSSKDLVLMTLGKDGFTSSDVALLKINVSNAPVLALSSAAVTQNQKITILGFPGDAENELVSQDRLSVSVTNGNVSSIREAAGGTGKLYQSDADASHGNSGGPAIGEDGAAIGLLTYRFKSGESNNAAKSYIRDIADFNKLAADNNVTFATKSSTQDAWFKGLELVSTNHYSAALKQFDIVRKNYPAHRLVSSYLDSSRAAIAAGKDVKDFPIALLIGGIVVSLASVAAAIFVIARHHGKHQVYKLAGQASGAAGGAYSVPSQLASQPLPAVVPGQNPAPMAPQQQYAAPQVMINPNTPTQQPVPPTVPQQPVPVSSTEPPQLVQ